MECQLWGLNYTAPLFDKQTVVITSQILKIYHIFISSLVVDYVNVCAYMCCKLERASSHFALFNPFSKCDEIKNMLNQKIT